MLIEEIKSISSNNKDLRKFAITMGVIFEIIGLLILLIKSNLNIAWFIIGILILVIGFIVPKLLLPFQKLWMILSVLLGWLSTRIILSLLFYLIVTPIKFIAKLFGKSFLDLKFNKEANTYWNYRREKAFNPTDYERQF